MLSSPRTTSQMLPLLRGVSRSFYVSIRLLPAPLREPIAVAYLLARASDTVADTTDLSSAGRSGNLETLAAAIEGRIPAPLAAASLAASFAPLQHDPDERKLIMTLPHCLAWLGELAPADRDDVRKVLSHITHGQALDIERFTQGAPITALATAAQLDEYTYLVAGSVGEFWTDLCFRHLPAFATLPQQQMRELGRCYGMGLQLVNILRDAGEDLAAGRCYFPGDELAAAGLDPQSVPREPALFEPVWRHWLGLAQQGIESGMQYADAVRSRRVRAASAMPALIGTRTLALVRANGPLIRQQKVKVPRREVRLLMARLAITLAGRASLQSMFNHLPAEGRTGEWENRGP